MNQNKNSDTPRPASVLSRTLKGFVLAGGILGLLWLEYSAGRGWMPAPLRGVPVIAELLENGFVIFITLAFIIWVALKEYAAIAGWSQKRNSGRVLAVTGIIFLVFLWAAYANKYGTVESGVLSLLSIDFSAIIILCLVFIGHFAWLSVRGPVSGSMDCVSRSVLGLTYVVLPLSFLIALRLSWGAGTLLTVLAVCKFTDIGAYYCGKLIGGPKLAPVVSPNKTWAGAFGGLIAAILAAQLLRIWFMSFIGPVNALFFGITIAFVAIMGDLAESLIKREAGVKDSGRLVGGYGGVLDMIDDVIFVAPCAYLFLLIGA